MSTKSQFKIDKSIEVLKLVLSNMDDHNCDFHKLFKILYFAEKKHLAKYGRPITGDKYIAMNAGPVPSNIYDILKLLRGDSIFSSSKDFSKYFEVKFKHHVYLVDENIDLDVFSESELECIFSAIEENKNLSFSILKDKSHDAAWEAASRDETMSIFDIAKAGGANDELLKYISISMENKRLELK